ncbi:MAG: SAM-dependent methyltransferase [Calditrichaeota bacterium]|nr:SAM-dependent methyltransferase [Calditrichota bacterium]
MREFKDGKILPSSFRDPGGFLFKRGGKLYRQVNKFCKTDYQSLINSGLYKKLCDQNLLIPHSESDIEPMFPDRSHCVIEPELLPFISYPYEWCFSQYQDAALATLKIQQIAIEHDMSMKDASAYNIQFHNGKPVLIDTLSFEKLRDNTPWVAYRQFCQHFLAPLVLMSYVDVRLGQLMRVYIDGIPLDLASQMLPRKTSFNLSLQMHIHAHARSQSKYADKQVKKSELKKNISRNSMLGLLDNLKSTVEKLQWKLKDTEWGDYYSATNYTDDSQAHKGELVEKFIKGAEPKAIWDIGANTGLFSQIGTKLGIPTNAFDIDPVAVEKNYIESRKQDNGKMLPLLLDLTNPSPGIGWNNRERSSLIERGEVDMVLSLALIHHLAISNNLPFSLISEFLASICQYLIIEFVPKSDSQVKILLATRDDIFPEYNRNDFESIFSERFEIVTREEVRGSERTLYLMKRNSS